MILVGCDFHSRYQQIACVDTETGDLIERRLEHENGEARAFYRFLRSTARVGLSRRRICNGSVACSWNLDTSWSSETPPKFVPW